MSEAPKISLLDHGYLQLVEHWGSDERIVEAARMSTQKGFLGWGPYCSKCSISTVVTFDGTVSPTNYARGDQHECKHDAAKPGDEKLLKFLWDNQHATPFEMAGFTVEVKAPIMVFREWHRHRTASYNEMSARYIPLPNENYLPSVERVLLANTTTTNKQAQGSGKLVTKVDALAWLAQLADVYDHAQRVYEAGLAAGVPKELARLCVPVGRYSVMRASANLRNWLAFLKLRCDNAAQWEIRQYANAAATLVREKFPRTYEVASASLQLPST
jgi:thymidylate synthase (FAD)